MSEDNENAMVKVNENEMENANAIVVPRSAEMNALQARIDRLYTDMQLDAMFWQRAEYMAKSPMLPPLFRGDTYACYALQQLAFVWLTNPMLLAPGLYKAKPESPLQLDGKTVRSIMNRFAPVKDHFIADEYFGDWSKVIGKFKMIESKKHTDDYGRPKLYRIPDWKPEDEDGLGIRLTATLYNGIPIKYELLLKQCQTRNSTLWGEDPQLQLFYRAIARMSRKYFPEILNGMYIREEIDEDEIEVRAEAVDGDQKGGSAVKKLKCKIVTKDEEKKKADEAKPANANNNRPDKPDRPNRQGAGAEGAARSSSAKAAEDMDQQSASGELPKEPDLKAFLSGYLESSHAPVTIELIERFLREDKHVKQSLNDKDFPANWTEYILKHPDALVRYVFDWSEKQGAQTDENGKLL